jgi:hypothetical protein
VTKSKPAASRVRRPPFTGAPLPALAAVILLASACATTRVAPADPGLVANVRAECERASAWCSGWIEGSYDAEADADRICPPAKDAYLEVIRGIALDALRDAPADEAAIVSVRRAFEERWACGVEPLPNRPDPARLEARLEVRP